MRSILFSYTNLVNVAKNKQTDMSSTWKSKTSSQNAVDGNADHFIAGGSCAVTKTQSNPWFKLDLQNSTVVSKKRLLQIASHLQ